MDVNELILPFLMLLESLILDIFNLSKLYLYQVFFVLNSQLLSLNKLVRVLCVS